SQWQWLRSSFAKPRFSEPNSSATRPPARSRLRMSCAPSDSNLSGWCNARLPAAVVPTTREQSATASATLPYCSARASNGAAPTAERASRNDASYGFTTRNRRKPRLLMARAAAPMLSGLRVDTNTTQRRSNSDCVGKTLFYRHGGRESRLIRLGFRPLALDVDFCSPLPASFSQRPTPHMTFVENKAKPQSDRAVTER